MDRCLILAALLLPVTSGCCTVRTYRGPAWPRSEVAHISNIIRIDYKDIEPGCSAEILPGARKVAIGDKDKTQIGKKGGGTGRSQVHFAARPLGNLRRSTQQPAQRHREHPAGYVNSNHRPQWQRQEFPN